MFYLDGGRQMVVELDGISHEADSNDPDLLEEAARLRAYLEAYGREEIEAARPVLAELRVRIGALGAATGAASVSHAEALALIDERLIR